ncbi:MAG: septal ring lytic transglycosylase RlpA family protein [Pseudomonadota bacterium]|nr:septal ring lytic transglycosylase RlpA family protein [Pseudomonadota bacterium]
MALSLGLLLGACSSVPIAPSATAPATARGAVSANSTASRAPALPAAGSGRGGYYQDDGPGDNPPANLLAVPDAEPKLEPLYPGASKPYVVFGKTYTPIGLDAPLKQRGTGSWYGKKFHGQKTSSGERYDMYKMTAAHPTMPLPSYARVTNLANGKQVIVRVNDRGPFHSSRIIDLSYTAALKLGYLGKGSSELEVERLLPDEIARMQRDRLGERALAQSDVTASTRRVALPAPSVTTPAPAVTDTLPPADMLGSLSAARPAPVLTAGASSAMATPVSNGSTDTPGKLPATLPNDRAPSDQSTAAPIQGSSLTMTDANASASVATAEGTPTTVASLGFYLQLGAFSQAANADAARQRIARDTAALSLAPLDVSPNGAVFRLFSGPYMTRAEALAAAQRMQDSGGLKAFVVQR